MPRRDDFHEVRGPHLHRDNASDDRRGEKRMGPGRILLIVGTAVALCGGCLVGGGYYARKSEARAVSTNNLRWMALAIREYESANGELPTNTYTADGKPLLSWRVHLLPYVEGDRLYKQFKLNEPWDSPNNRLLLTYMPTVYRIPGQDQAARDGLTHYRGFSSPGAVFDRRRVQSQTARPDEALTISGFKDRLSETVLVVEAAEPVEWTKPDDLEASPGRPFPRMANFHRGGKFVIVFADGSARLLRPDVSEDILRALVTHSGGEQLPADWDE